MGSSLYVRDLPFLSMNILHSPRWHKKQSYGSWSEWESQSLPREQLQKRSVLFHFYIYHLNLGERVIEPNYSTDVQSWVSYQVGYFTERCKQNERKLKAPNQQMCLSCMAATGKKSLWTLNHISGTIDVFN